MLVTATSIKQLRHRDQMSASIYSVIVNWNLAEETADCIHSLLAAGAQPGQIVVVDNGSTDGSAEKLSAQFGQKIQLILSQENLGFAGGNNLGIRHALTYSAEWVLLLNNDTVVAPNFFAEMKTAIQEQPNYPIIAPLIFYHGEPQRIWSLGDCLLPGTLITRSLWRNQEVRPDLPAFVPVDFLNACCILVHHTVFARIDLLDTTFFMYAEDVDFCWRARRAGFKLGCWTRAHIWHKVARSTGVYHPARRYWQIRNQIQVYRRYANVWQYPLMLFFTLVRSLWLTTGDLRYGRKALATKTLSGWYEGWFGHEKARHA